MCFNKKKYSTWEENKWCSTRKTFSAVSHKNIIRWFFKIVSTNGLILYFSVYKLPKGTPTFIACFVDVCDVVHSPITFWTREEKRTQKDLSGLLAMTHIHTHIHKRSITFQVCSFYCARDFFFALCEVLYDITYIRLCLRRLTKEVYLPAYTRWKGFCPQ